MLGTVVRTVVAMRRLSARSTSMATNGSATAACQRTTPMATELLSALCPVCNVTLAAEDLTDSSRRYQCSRCGRVWIMTVVQRRKDVD